jgi:hypothetical protein
MKYQGGMKVCGQEINGELVSRITATLEREPHISRRELSRRVCEWANWRGANGKLQDVSCRKLLLDLHKRSVIRLPVAQPWKSQRVQRQRRPYEIPGVSGPQCSLKALGKVELVPVTNRHSRDSWIWNTMLEQYHYLGSGPLCGAQMRYLVKSEKAGWVGALSFSAACLRLKERDRWIGWSDKARHHNLHRIICNSRFLVVPQVRVLNLASRILGLCMRRIAADWDARYGYRPVLVETFVDPSRFKGTCYLAANWKKFGETAGRSTPYPNGKVSGGKKTIFAYPLCRDWRNLLATEPPDELLKKPRPKDFLDWAEEEFWAFDVFDPRLKRRLIEIAKDFRAQPGVLIPQACNGSKAKTKAAYRFLDNKRIDMETLLEPHVLATAERIKEHPVVLSVQDTTTLNYTSHTTTEGLGPIGTKRSKSKGLLVHDTMAFTPEGTPLGLLDIQCWARHETAQGTRPSRSLAIEEKESFKWLKSYRATSQVQALCPDTMLVSVGDRESDIYELFCEAQHGSGDAQLLVRAERSRNRKVGQAHLWEKMGSLKVAGHKTVNVPRKGSRPSRVANLHVRYAPVQLEPPKGKDLPKVKVWAVYARETGHAKSVTSPLEWMLLTTIEVKTLKKALEVLGWYEQRWGIEVYHRTLKSGCRIEDRLLNTADRLEACLTIDMIVAWRVFWLTKQSRETPDVPCDRILTQDEWKVLSVYKTGEIPDKPPALFWAVLVIAGLGGFLGRKSDGYPGATTIRRGLERLQHMVAGYRLACYNSMKRAGP